MIYTKRQTGSGNVASDSVLHCEDQIVILNFRVVTFLLQQMNLAK
jgi:hypothetical protein